MYFFVFFKIISLSWIFSFKTALWVFFVFLFLPFQVSWVVYWFSTEILLETGGFYSFATWAYKRSNSYYWRPLLIWNYFVPDLQFNKNFTDYEFTGDCLIDNDWTDCLWSLKAPTPVKPPAVSENITSICFEPLMYQFCLRQLSGCSRKLSMSKLDKQLWPCNLLYLKEQLPTVPSDTVVLRLKDPQPKFGQEFFDHQILNIIEWEDFLDKDNCVFSKNFFVLIDDNHRYHGLKASLVTRLSNLVFHKQLNWKEYAVDFIIHTAYANDDYPFGTYTNLCYTNRPLWYTHKRYNILENNAEVKQTLWYWTLFWRLPDSE